MDKEASQHIERDQGSNTSADIMDALPSKLENGEQADVHSEGIASLSAEHRDYLLRRHGTLDLDPIPDMNDADPYNWPYWEKLTNLILIAFHAMMATFTAGAIQSAFIDIAMEFHVSLQKASYLTSLVIAILGVAPLFWRPLANKYGRRPVFLVSLLLSLVGNVGCAESPSYAVMGFCRAITAFFISPAAAIGSAVVAETFFRKNRGKYIGIWIVMVTLGVPLAPLIMGFVAQRAGFVWIYWVLACINAGQLLLYLFLGPETLYIRSSTPVEAHDMSPVKQEYFTFRRIDPTPFTIWDFIHPLTFVYRRCVVTPAVIYSMIFSFGSILVSIMIPQIFVVKFHLNTEQIGLQNISIIVGSILGEQIGGFMSDRWMLRRQRKDLHRPEPELRLWLSYIGQLLTICGVVVFLVQTGRASSHWNITPLIGAAIGAAGNQIVTTVMITYAVDCYREEAASVGVFITFVRQIWGFIGPFWYPKMIANVGLNGSAGIVTAMMVVFGIIPTILLQWRGKSWR